IDVCPNELKQTTVKLEPAKVNALLGTDLSEDTMRDILLRLGFKLEGDTIYVPSWRADVEHYSDIAEEVARFYGYNEIPTAFSGGISTAGGYTPEQQLERRIGEVCRSMGLDEIITYSFISPTYYDKIRMPADSPLRDSLKILNPLGEDTSIMRTTILPSMLEILTRNYNYRNKEAFLYEIGRIYLKRPDGMADEPKIVSLGAYGEKVNFFTLKGWVEKLLKELGAQKLRFVAEKTDPAYHPGRCAKVYAGGVEIGVLGQIHPLVAANYGVDAEIYCAELKFDALNETKGALSVYKPLPRFPSVTRDIAVVCKADIPVGDMIECIMANGGQYLKDCTVFDVYTGSHVLAGMKSVAFSLTMRSDEETLTAEHAEETVAKVLKALAENYGAAIR
ncbi:MAG: phenylalanine--tRNA ligase subunit beta, partial [Oscillospiraceae bacterium]|nr:phenylalanine--tRNA ligase subunit beta [Oscillospiraceae bacterium]